MIILNIGTKRMKAKVLDGILMTTHNYKIIGIICAGYLNVPNLTHDTLRCSSSPSARWAAPCPCWRARWRASCSWRRGPAPPPGTWRPPWTSTSRRPPPTSTSRKTMRSGTLMTFTFLASIEPNLWSISVIMNHIDYGIIVPYRSRFFFGTWSSEI